ncbi:MAG: toll/interleukin-1 receptor domain-containing protein, partial [Planctomycetes bacterium]|nr:toll/interleukin-1 receptor domain-containing protein [Planctomycetota bacterium]
MTNASGSGQGTRATGHIFISHASADDAFVKELRQALEASDHLVWVDSRNLRGGSKLAREVEQAIQDAAKVIAVLSLNTVNSRWVRREIEKALEVEKRRKPDGYSVVPLLLPGIEPAALEGWFDEEPVGVRVKTGPGGLADAMPAILAALEKRLPTEQEAAAQPEAGRLDELVLTLSGPK